MDKLYPPCDFYPPLNLAIPAAVQGLAREGKQVKDATLQFIESFRRLLSSLGLAWEDGSPCHVLWRTTDGTELASGSFRAFLLAVLDTGLSTGSDGHLYADLKHRRGFGASFVLNMEPYFAVIGRPGNGFPSVELSVRNAAIARACIEEALS